MSSPSSSARICSRQRRNADRPERGSRALAVYWTLSAAKKTSSKPTNQRCRLALRPGSAQASMRPTSLHRRGAGGRGTKRRAHPCTIASGIYQGRAAGTRRVVLVQSGAAALGARCASEGSFWIAGSIVFIVNIIVVGRQDRFHKRFPLRLGL